MSNHSEDAPIIWEEGINTTGGDEGMFRNFLEQFEDLTFTENMENLFDAMMKMDYPNIHTWAHRIKGPASYIAAKRWAELSKELIAASDKNDEKTVIDLYLKLLIESKALLVYLAKVLNKTPNLANLERYDQEFRAKYSKSRNMRVGEAKAIELDLPNHQPPGCCAACNIF